MELDWLQTFVVAAELSNFRRAAEALHIAQPTVSLHIQKLESHLGLELFERRGRNVQLSPAGKRYLPHARNVLDTYSVGRDDMLLWRQGYADKVTIAVSPLVATTLLPRWIQRYTVQEEGTQFSILIRESGQVLDSILSGESQVGFTRVPAEHAQVHCIPLYSDRIILVAPGDSHDMDSPLPTPTELFHEYTLLTHNHPAYWDRLMVSLRRVYPDVRTMQVSQVHVSIHWIIEKLGVSFLPASTVQRDLLRGSLIEVPFDEFTLPHAYTYLLIHKTMSTQSVLKFTDYVTGYMRDRGF